MGGTSSFTFSKSSWKNYQWNMDLEKREELEECRIHLAIWSRVLDVVFQDK